MVSSGPVTREDLKLILRMSIHMARVDQELNLEERRILMRFADAMRLSALERERLMGKTLTLGEALKKLSSDAGKKLLVKTVCAVACSDGALHESEIDFLEKVLSNISLQMMVLPHREWKRYQQEALAEIEHIVEGLEGGSSALS